MSPPALDSDVHVIDIDEEIDKIMADEEVPSLPKDDEAPTVEVEKPTSTPIRSANGKSSIIVIENLFFKIYFEKHQAVQSTKSRRLLKNAYYNDSR